MNPTHKLVRVKQAWPSLAALVLLAGCGAPKLDERARTDIATRSAVAGQVTAGRDVSSQDGATTVTGSERDASRRAQEQRAAPVLRKSAQAWVAGGSVPLSPTDDAAGDLPAVFNERIRLAFPDRVHLSVMAERLTALSKVPVRIKSDVEALRAATGGPVAQPVTVPMQWDGSLASYLDHVTDLTGLSWDFRDSTIVVERLRTEFLELLAPEGDTSYSMSMAGADSGTSGINPGANSGSNSSTAAAEVKEKGQFNTVASVLATLKQIVKDTPGSDVVRAEGSGRFIVTTTKETMAKAREFVRSENAALNRQAQVQIDIYSVRNSEGDQQGVDWQGVVRAVSQAIGASVTSPGTLLGEGVGGMAFSILDATAAPGSNTARRFGGSKVVLDLLNEHGTAAEYRPVSLVGRNRQWMRQASLNSRAYVAETTPGSGTTAATAAPGLRPATLVTGDRYLVQAHIADSGLISLRFGIGLSSLVSIASFSSGSGITQQTIQTPQTSSQITQSEVVMRPGQVLVLTGLSREVTSDDRRTLAEGAPVGLGGSSKVSRSREDFIIFVRPTLL